jgi:predicted O-methyltransferase YrrM
VAEFKPGPVLTSYLKFLFTSKTRHGVHSPFVYKLIEDVIYDENPYYAYREIEAIREALLKDASSIEVEDFGAGSRVFKSKKRTISAIARTSAKLPKFGQLLFRLVKHFKPENILELGTSLGISALYLAKPSSKARVTTIEGSPAIAAIAKTTFLKAGAGNIELATGKFDDVLPGLLESIPAIDFAFIDGNHKKEPTLKYFKMLLEKSHNDTVLIFDDIHWSKEMEQAWEEIKAHEKVKVTIDLFFLGLVFFRKEQPKEHFKVRY